MVNSEKDLQDALKRLEEDQEFARELTDSITARVVKATENEAYVESASALAADEKKGITDTVEKLFARHLKFYFTVNPHHLGGFRVRVGDWEVDATLATKLVTMKHNITRHL